ncbi:isoprenoid synthase domain-containing protein [Aspergillus heterothallicus]
MYPLDAFPFQHSSVPDLEAERPAKYFNTLPFRVRTVGDECGSTIDRVVAEWSSVTGKGFPDTVEGHATDLIRYVLPECPTELIAPVTRFIYFLLLWDDATDVLDSVSHESLILDFRLGVVSQMKLGYCYCELELNRVYIQSLFEMLKQVAGGELKGDASKTALEVFDSTVRAQAPPLQSITWEAYKTYRATSIAGRLVTALVPTMSRLRLNQEALDSIAHMTELCSLIAGLSNDFYSFHKEFDEHARAGSLDAIHNGMAVLMGRYGYSEAEAEDIMKQEVLDAERSLMEKYEKWKSSSEPKSDELRHFMLMSILAVGGASYWQSFSPRYQRENLTTTAEDRAQLVGSGYDAELRLSNHSSPATMQNVTNGYSESAASKSVKELVNDQASLIMEDLLAPFEKAPAEEAVLAPWKYTQSLPGKRTVGRMIECLQAWFTLPTESVNIIAEVTTMLFNATLMLDDIQDESQLRRGKPAAHAVFGQAQTVNSATYLYVKGGRRLKGVIHADDCGKVFLDELETLAFGQALELQWKFEKTCPSTKEYLVMIDNKTGGFFRLVLRLLEVESVSEPDPELMHLFTLLGRYYQIRDDYMNLASEEYTAKKGFCEDLSEGKFSFPLLHLLQHSPHPDTVRGVMFHREDKTDFSIEMKQFILAEMKEAGSLTYTMNLLEELFDAIIRRVKCDEEQPHCRRCKSTGRKCDGYSPSPPAQHYPSRMQGTQHGTTITAAQENHSCSLSSSEPPLRIIHHTPAVSIPTQMWMFPAISDRLLTEDEHRALEFFHVETVSCFGARAGRHLLAAACRDPGIRLAAIALGTMHRLVLFRDDVKAYGDGDGDGNVVGGVDEEGTRLALRQYNLAIRRGLAQFEPRDGGAKGTGPSRSGSGSGLGSGAESADSILSMCVLFFCFESLQGHYRAALRHGAAGLRILAQQQQQQQFLREGQSATNALLPADVIHSMFATVEGQMLEIDGQSPILNDDYAGPLVRSGLLQQQHQEPFWTIEEASDSFRDVYNSALRLLSFEPKIDDPQSEEQQAEITRIMEQVLARHGQIQADLDAWTLRFEYFIANIFRPESADREAQQVLRMLQLWRRILGMILGMGWPPSETVWDGFTDEFAIILDLAEEIVALSPPSIESSSLSSASQTDTRSAPKHNPTQTAQQRTTLPTLLPRPLHPSSPSPATQLQPSRFTLFLGILPALWTVAIHSRASRIRYRAISLMARSNRREGVWDSALYARLASRIARREEEEAGIAEGAEYVPEEIPPAARVTIDGQLGEGRCARVTYLKGGVRGEEEVFRW